MERALAFVRGIGLNPIVGPKLRFLRFVYILNGHLYINTNGNKWYIHSTNWGIKTVLIKEINTHLKTIVEYVYGHLTHLNIINNEHIIIMVHIIIKTIKLFK